MTSRARKILEEALTLPEEDRLYLVEALQESIEPVESHEEVSPKPQPAPALNIPSPQERLANAARDGLVRLAEPKACKTSTDKTPPLRVGGKPASEMVIEDRR